MINLIRNDAAGKLVLRLTLGGFLLFHGIAKLLHPGSLDAIGSKLVDAGLPEIIAYGVYIGEVIAPLMVILGIYARVGGLVIVINMLVAILLVHSGDILSLTDHGGWRLELQGFYLFCAVAVMLLGSGRLAVKPD